MDKMRNSNLTIRQDTIIAMPSPDQVRCISVREFDLKRIRKRISQIEQKRSYLSTWYPILFGVSVSFAVGIYPMKDIQGLSPWLIPVYSCISISTLILGIILVYLDRKFISQKKSDGEDITREMDDLLKMFNIHEEKNSNSIS